MIINTDIEKRKALLQKVLIKGKKYSITPRISNIERYYIYAIVNKENHKLYVGKRKCKCPIEKDTYFGSGSMITKLVSILGRECFEKIIVAELETEDDAYALEKIIVNYEFVMSNDTYNLAIGGRISNDEENIKARLARNDIKNYQYKPSERKDFKIKCKLRGLDFNDFQEVGDGNIAGKGSRLYFYFNKEDLKNSVEVHNRYKECLIVEEAYLTKFSIRRYEIEEVTRDSFKSACRTRGLNFKDFYEVWSGLSLKDKYENSTHKSYLYLYFDKKISYPQNILDKIEQLKTAEKEHRLNILKKENDRKTLPIETFQSRSVFRKGFKTICDKRNLDFSSFEEIEDLSMRGKSRNKKYFYIRKQE